MHIAAITALDLVGYARGMVLCGQSLLVRRVYLDNQGRKGGESACLLLRVITREKSQRAIQTYQHAQQLPGISSMMISS